MHKAQGMWILTRCFCWRSKSSPRKRGLSYEPTIGKPHLPPCPSNRGRSREGNLADFAHEGRALSETKRVLHDFFQQEDHIDDIVRQKILSLSRHVPPGSREWDVLYR